MIYFLIATGIIFILIILAFKLVKDSFKVVIGAVSLLVLIIVSSSILLYLDAKELRDSMGTSTSRILIVQDDKILSGFDMTLKNISDVTPFSKEQLDDFSTFYKNGNYEYVKGDTYKLIIMSINSFNNSLEENIEFLDGKTIQKNVFFDLLKSDNATEFYVENILSKLIISDDDEKIENVKESLRNNIRYDDDYKFKGMISNLVFTKLVVDDTEKIIKEFKNKNVIIYPETFILKIIRFLPDDAIKSRLSLIKDKIEDSVYKNARAKIEGIIS